MGERQLLKKVGLLDDVRQGKDKTLASYYRLFNNNLIDIGSSPNESFSEHLLDV